MCNSRPRPTPLPRPRLSWPLHGRRKRFGRGARAPRATPRDAPITARYGRLAHALSGFHAQGRSKKEFVRWRGPERPPANCAQAPVEILRPETRKVSHDRPGAPASVPKRPARPAPSSLPQARSRNPSPFGQIFKRNYATARLRNKKLCVCVGVRSSSNPRPGKRKRGGLFSWFGTDYRSSVRSSPRVASAVAVRERISIRSRCRHDAVSFGEGPSASGPAPPSMTFRAVWNPGLGVGIRDSAT